MEIEKISSAIPVTSSVNRFQQRMVQTVSEQEKNIQHQEEGKHQFSKEDLHKTIDGINKFIEPSHTNLKFQLHDKLNKYYVAIVDSTTNEVIKEIPPKKFLDMYAVMLESIGLIVDHRI